MTQWRTKMQELLATLEQERDELKLRIHLARAEGRDELARMDQRLADLRLKAMAAGDEAKDVAGDVGQSARKLADEIREGFDRIRKTF
jgi:hypothetical protein